MPNAYSYLRNQARYFKSEGFTKFARREILTHSEHSQIKTEETRNLNNENWPIVIGADLGLFISVSYIILSN